MDERLCTLAAMFAKEQKNIDMQESNFKRYKSTSVFYRGKPDDEKHEHEINIKRLALARIGKAYNKLIARLNP